MEKIKVSKNFAEGLLRLFPYPAYSHGKWIVEEDPKTKDHLLVVWDIDAPIPTQEEIDAALQIPAEPDEVTKLKQTVEALPARLDAIDGKKAIKPG